MALAARASALLAVLCAVAAPCSAFSPAPALSLRRPSPPAPTGQPGGARVGSSLVVLEAKKGGKKGGKGGKKNAAPAKNSEAELPLPSAASNRVASADEDKGLSEADKAMLEANMMGNFDPSAGGDPMAKGAEGMVMPGLPGIKATLIDEKAVDSDVKKLIGDRSLEQTFVPIPKGAIVDEPEKKRLEMLGKDEDAAFGLSGDVMRNLKTATWVGVALLVAVEVFVQTPLSAGLKGKVGVDTVAVDEYRRTGRKDAGMTQQPGIRPFEPVALPDPPAVAARKAAEAAKKAAAEGGAPAAPVAAPAPAAAPAAPASPAPAR